VKLVTAAIQANMAYSTKLCESDTLRIHDDALTGTRCLAVFCKSTKRLSIVFRGTISLRNWVQVNLRFWPMNGVHSGFSRVVDRHWKFIQEALNFYDHEELFIIGHSLGGAAASEVMRRLYSDSYPPPYCVTFGAVRAHRKWVVQSSSCGASTLRVVNNNDVVPRILGVTFDHIGKFLYFNRKGVASKRISEISISIDRLLGRFARPCDIIADHVQLARTYIAHSRNVKPTVEELLG